MWFQKLSIPSPCKGFFLRPFPHPSGNSSQASYIYLNFWAFENPPPPKEFSIPSVGGGYGYFLELHIRVIYALDLAFEKHSDWNKVVLRSKFPCESLELNSWVEPNYSCGTWLIQTSIFSCSDYLIEGIRLGEWNFQQLNWVLLQYWLWYEGQDDGSWVSYYRFTSCFATMSIHWKLFHCISKSFAKMSFRVSLENLQKQLGCFWKNWPQLFKGWIVQWFPEVLRKPLHYPLPLVSDSSSGFIMLSNVWTTGPCWFVTPSA